MNRCKDRSFEAFPSFGITACFNLTNTLTSETEALGQFNVRSWHYVRPYSLEANSAFSLYSTV
jgi:hypothetical protein